MTAASAAARWSAFVRERHPPSTHLVMAASFALGNAAVAATAGGVSVPPHALTGAVALAFVFFLRLRVLDEIKDYDVDRAVNPGRPLARGLVTPLEARRAAWLLAATELAILAAAEPRALAAWVLLFAYSLGMFAEFGVGAWLRPRLELYAVSHTLVAGCLGVVVASVALGLPLNALPAGAWLFALANWAVFNLFEFSRKSFAPAEERAEVASYSSRLGARGAAALSLVCVAAALASAWIALASSLAGAGGAAAWTPFGSPAGIAGPVGFGAIALGAAALATTLPYATAPGLRTAALFRTGMSVWAVAFYALLAALPVAGGA